MNEFRSDDDGVFSGNERRSTDDAEVAGVVDVVDEVAEEADVSKVADVLFLKSLFVDEKDFKFGYLNGFEIKDEILCFLMNFSF